MFISKFMENHDSLIIDLFFTDNKINNSNNIKYKRTSQNMI